MTTLATRVEKKRKDPKLGKTETQTPLAHAEKAQAEKSIQGEKVKSQAKTETKHRTGSFHCGRPQLPPGRSELTSVTAAHMVNGVLPKTMQEPITSLFFFDMVCDSIVDSGVYFRRGARGGSLETSFVSQLSLCNTHTPQTPDPKKKISKR